MSKVPRMALGAAAGLGIGLATYNYLEPEPNPTYAVENLNNCYDALGAQAIKAAELNTVCEPYASTYSPTKISPVENGNRTLSFTLPSQAELLKAEQPTAIITDQNVIANNTKRNGEAVSAALLVGVIGGIAIGSLKPLRRLDTMSFKRQKKSSRAVPQVQ